jgi:hypothetical protein
LQTADLAGLRTIGIHIVSEAVHERLFSVLDAAFEEVDHCLLAGVLQQLQTRDRDGHSRLPDRILSRREHIGRLDVENLVTRIPLVGRVVGVFEFLNDGATAGERFDVPATVEAHQRSVVAEHVVRELLASIAKRGRDDFRKAGRGHGGFLLGLTAGHRRLNFRPKTVLRLWRHLPVRASCHGHASTPGTCRARLCVCNSLCFRFRILACEQ